jgi:hypothetical protein
MVRLNPPSVARQFHSLKSFVGLLDREMSGQGARPNRKETPMLKNPSCTLLIAALSALALPGLAQAQSSAPNLSGTYRCQPQPASCKWQGQTPTISQSGTKLELQIDKNELAEAKVISNLTVSAGPPYNADGLIRPDHSIEWSNGTKWVKQ